MNRRDAENMKLVTAWMRSRVPLRKVSPYATGYRDALREIDKAVARLVKGGLPAEDVARLAAGRGEPLVHVTKVVHADLVGLDGELISTEIKCTE